MPKKKTPTSNEPVESYKVDESVEIEWHLEIVKQRLANLDAEMEGSVSLEEMKRRVATRLV